MRARETGSKTRWGPVRKKCLWTLLQGSHRKAGNQAAAKSGKRWQARGRELAGRRADCSSRGSGEMVEKREKTEGPQSQEGDVKGGATSTGLPKGRLPSADITLYLMSEILLQQLKNFNDQIVCPKGYRRYKLQPGTEWDRKTWQARKGSNSTRPLRYNAHFVTHLRFSLIFSSLWISSTDINLRLHLDQVHTWAMLEWEIRKEGQEINHLFWREIRSRLSQLLSDKFSKPENQETGSYVVKVGAKILKYDK